MPACCCCHFGKMTVHLDNHCQHHSDHFFCHHEHQGKGVGRHLMEHLLRVGELQGITKFYSEVSITARPFYEKFGFKVVKEQTIEIRGQKLRDFVMEILS